MAGINCFAILPANVRYNNELTSFEKVLYSEIAKLTEKELDICCAEDAYFADCFNKSELQVSEAITNLSEKGYITVFADSAGQSVARQIRINTTAI